jgi:PPOX class probable F420-dependent enzyme
MPSRRDLIRMTPEELQAFLEERHTMNVATIGPSGHPHVHAMWYGFVDGKPAFWTFGKSQKIMNLRRDPKITALVEDGETYNELRGAELIGTGRIVENKDEIIAIGAAVAERYTGPVTERAMTFIEAQADKRLGVVIDVERVVTWDHRKLGGAY